MCPESLCRGEGAVEEHRSELISITGYRHTHAARKTCLCKRCDLDYKARPRQASSSKTRTDSVVRAKMKMLLALLLDIIEFTSSVMAAGGGGGDDGIKTNGLAGWRGKRVEAAS